MDKHHVLYNAREWESRPQYKELRQNPGLIIPIDRDVHNELHRNVAHVPVLGYYGILAVNKEFYRGRTPLDNVENLMFAIETIQKNDRMTEIDKGLAELALMAVDLQRPYIVDGI